MYKLILPALLGLLLLRPAPPAAAAEQVVIHLNSSSNHDPRDINALISRETQDAFLRRHPNYSFTYLSSLRLHNQGAMDAFVMSLMGNRAPDIISIPFRNSTSFIDQGYLLPLDDFYDQWGKECNLSQIIHPAVWPVINQNGHIYFVPNQPGFTALYYRKDLLENAGLTRPPATWDELYAWAEKLTDPEKGVWGYGMYGSTNNPMSWHWLNFVKQAGAELFSQDQNGRWMASFNDDNGIEALKFYHKLLRNRWTRNGKEYMGVSRIQLHTLWDELEEGTIAMVCGNGNYDLLFDTKMNYERISMAPLPAGPTGIHAQMANTNLQGINSSIRDTARIRAAWELLRFGRSDEAEYIRINRLVEHGYAPFLNPQLLEKYGFERYIKDIPPEWLETYRVSSASAFPEPYLRGTNGLYGNIDPALNAISISDDVDYQAELDKAVERINSKLLGYVPDDVMKKRRLITWLVVAAIVLLVLVQLLRMVHSTIRRLNRQQMFRSRKRLMRLFTRRKVHQWAIILMLPAILSVLFWEYIPIFRSIFVALTDYTMAAGSTFVGLDNFTDALWQLDFWIGVKNTVVYVGLTVLMGFIGPVLLALMLNEIPVGSMALRIIYFLPAAVGPLVVSLLWVNFYDPTPEGLFNRIMLFMGLPVQEWLKDPRIAMVCVILPGIWQNLGIGSIFYLAALKNIPEDLYEVADLDGAGILTKTWHVTLMNLRPLLIIQLIGTVIGAFHATQRILVMTGGGPAKATHTLGLEIFYSAFTYMRFGYATAVAWIMGSLIIGFTVLQLQYLRSNTRQRRLAGSI